jgi:hypothetical protein
VLTASDALHERVQRFVREALRGHGDERFDDLALDLVRHQARHVPAIARLHRAHGFDATTASDPDLIPAVPSDAFRHRRIAVHGPECDTRVFRTSGTSGGSELRGQHPMRRLDTYQLGALSWARELLWPDDRPLRFVGLVSRERDAPDSSLGFMLARFAEHLRERSREHHDAEASWHFDGAALDVEGVRRACAQAASSGDAVLLAGTSFAFVHLLDALGDERLPLPDGSRAMQTGGFKGRSRTVEANELRDAIARLFGLRASHVVGEYGMTELSSQLYQGTLAHALGASPAAANPAAYRPPPWLRVSAVDPESLEPLPTGREGLCRMLDLANVDSSLAIQTYDRVAVQADGSVLLLGRAPGATPRGCSLALEHLLAPEDGS